MAYHVIKQNGQTYFVLKADKQDQMFTNFLTILDDLNKSPNTSVGRVWNQDKRNSWLNPILKLLNHVSDDIISLVTDIVRRQAQNLNLNIMSYAQRLPFVSRYISVLRDLRYACNNWGNNSKYKSLQFVAPYFSERELTDFGFKCSWKSLRTAKKVLESNNNNPTEDRGQFAHAPKVITDEEKQSIQHHLFINSTPIPNMFLKKATFERGYPVQKRRLNGSLRAIYKIFPWRKNICFSNFVFVFDNAFSFNFR